MGDDILCLLINPWIVDFAAYNLWAEPLGLFYVASILDHSGGTLCYIDCLESTHRQNPSQKPNGCSKYLRTIIEKPDALSFVPRNYALYGIDEDEFIERLGEVPVPDVILVTSLMTYWYPGVSKTITLLRKFYKKRIPTILGGIYPTICPDHAIQTSGTDYIFTENNLSGLLLLIEKVTGKRFSHLPSLATFSQYPTPMHELSMGRRFFSLLTGRGCPYQCTYCATHLLWQGFIRRDPTAVADEIELYVKRLNIENIAFYDDALLVDADNHIVPILDEVKKRGLQVSYHLPNGIHAELVTPAVAALFYSSGIETIRIGLETADEVLQHKTGAKITNDGYIRAIGHLREAGYSRKALGTYIIAGLPGQAEKDVESSLDFVYQAGSAPFLAYFSPIPGTAIWQSAVKSSPFPIASEPLFHNNSVFIRGNPSFSSEKLQSLKDRAVELRNLP